MSWVYNLYETYDTCINGAPENRPVPVAHCVFNTHVTIHLDKNGKFLGFDAPLIKRIPVPVTEESCSRSSNIAPHPMMDTLQFIAADLGTGKKKGGYAAYKALIEGWAFGKNTHPKVRAVCGYISKGTITRDLSSLFVKKSNAEGGYETVKVPATEPEPGKKVETKPVAVESFFPRWNIDGLGDTWTDPSLWESWIKHNEEVIMRDAPTGFCMVTGEVGKLAKLHPKYLRFPGDGAKLISSEGEEQKRAFVYRGLFTAPEQACTVSYEASQKAHNCLRYLIERQGIRIGQAEKGGRGRVMIAWSPNALQIPTIFDRSSGDEGKDETGTKFAGELKKAARGTPAKLSPSDHICILCLDAPTQSRLSILFYRELLWSDYLERFGRWNAEFPWRRWHRQKREKEGDPAGYYEDLYPSPYEICNAAYGVKKGVNDKAWQSRYSELAVRVMMCVVDELPFPPDTVELCVKRAMAGTHDVVDMKKFNKRSQWIKDLETACAVYRGYCARLPQNENRRYYQMALEPERKTRDYLYGRMAATADYAERAALKAKGEVRSTNVERLMQQFSQSPYATWIAIERQLQPYLNYLKMRSRYDKLSQWIYNKSTRLLTELISRMEPEEYRSSARLSGEFLLGYHCQLADFYSKKQQTEKEVGETS
jgi:CRISPR-associated protein Csd1